MRLHVWLVWLRLIWKLPPDGANSVDFMVEAQWEPEVSHRWITHDVFPGRDRSLIDPVAPKGKPVLDATRTDNVKTNVRWSGMFRMSSSPGSRKSICWLSLVPLKNGWW